MRHERRRPAARRPSPRRSPSSVNGKPRAAFALATRSARSSTATSCSRSNSTIPTEGLTQYDWDFGDGSGTESTERNPAHAVHHARREAPVTADGQRRLGGLDDDTHDGDGQRPRPPQPPPLTSPRSARESARSVNFVSSLDAERRPAIASQTWDLDGDGQFDDASGGRRRAVDRRRLHVALRHPGERQRLRVEAEGGAAAVSERHGHAVQAKPTSQGEAGLLSPSPVISLQRPGPAATATRIRLLSVRGPKRALVTVRCKGKGCPAAHRRKRTKGSGALQDVRALPARGVQARDLRLASRARIGHVHPLQDRAPRVRKRVNRCLPPGRARRSRAPLPLTPPICTSRANR